VSGVIMLGVVMLSVDFYLLLCWMSWGWVLLCWMSWRQAAAYKTNRQKLLDANQAKLVSATKKL